MSPEIYLTDIEFLVSNIGKSKRCTELNNINLLWNTISFIPNVLQYIYVYETNH